MDRRHFLRLSGALCAATTTALPQVLRAQQAPVTVGWRGFELTTDISVADSAAHTRI